MEKQSKLSIIVVSYNTREYLKECLDSIYRTKSVSASVIECEIIVVDNASEDGSAQMVKKNFPAVDLIVNEQNLGFAAANNQGIKRAKGRYILLLNPDTVVLDDALEKMTDFMDAHPELGISSCQLLNEDKSVQPTGGYFPDLLRVFAWMFFLDDLPLISGFFPSYHPHPSFYQRERQLDWVTGAFLFIRKKVVKRIGLLDEDFFMYVEEVDYCFRAKQAGFKVFFWPQVEVIHLGRKSLKSAAGAFVKEYQGLKLFYQKHFPQYQLVLLALFLKIGAILRFTIFGIILGKEEARKAYAQAFKVI